MSSTAGGNIQRRDSHDRLIIPAGVARNYSAAESNNSNNMEQPHRRRPAANGEAADGGISTSDVSVVPNARRRADTTDSERERQFSAAELKYGAKHFIKLFPPIVICMILTIVILKVAPQPQAGAMTNPFLFSESSSASGTDNLISALKNVGIVLLLIIVMTFLMVALYYFRCYCILKGWFTLAIFLMFFFLFTVTLITMLVQMNIALDYISVLLFTWNLGVMGVMSLLWHAPLPVRQVYHIVVCSMIAFTLVRMLPPVTTWVLLGALVIWDLVAVLTPCGPLKKLVELAQERNEQESGVFNAIIYSTGIAIITDGDDDNESGERDENHGAMSTSVVGESLALPQAREVQEALNSGSSSHSSDLPGATASSAPPEEKGVKLGLGDFVFYSILIARATQDAVDTNTVLACFISILVGLCFTLVLLAIWKKALPALPISLTFGLIFYFGTSNIISPFTEKLADQMLFI